jgi:hypothetical protein
MLKVYTKNAYRNMTEKNYKMPITVYMTRNIQDQWKFLYSEENFTNEFWYCNYAHLVSSLKSCPLHIWGPAILLCWPLILRGLLTLYIPGYIARHDLSLRQLPPLFVTPTFDSPRLSWSLVCLTLCGITLGLLPRSFDGRLHIAWQKPKKTIITELP